MEKRALLAFVLSLAVLLLWEIYFQAPPQPPNRTGQHTESQAPQSPAPAPAEPEKTPAKEAPKGVAPESLPPIPTVPLDKKHKTWTVDSPLYKTQFVSPGGRIDLFELKKYRQQVEPDSPLTDLISTRTTGYLPLAVDFLRHPGWDLSTRPFSSDNPTQVSLASGEPSRSLTLSTEEPGQFKFSKILSFSPETYTIDMEMHVKNLSSEPLEDQLGVSFYFKPFAGIDKENPYNKSRLTVLQKGSLEYFESEDIRKKNPVITPPLNWLAYQNSYFINATIPAENSSDYQIVPHVLDANQGLMQVVYLTSPFRIEANGEKTIRLRLYMGPKEQDQLAKAGNHLTEAIDYGWVGFLAKPLARFLDLLYGFTHNYGVAIIILTIIIKIIFWPLTHKSYKSMQVMKKLQPKMAQIREKYKDNREKMNEELMQLYRTYKANPLGGCLPMLLQIPVFFALYRMLYNSVELLHKPFVLWINDLTAPDRLSVGFPIPYLGGLPVLTLLMGVSMFIQQKMTPSTGDPRQEKIMLLMPVIFTVFFINFPSGLVLYWLVNNVLSIVQQYWINRHA